MPADYKKLHRLLEMTALVQSGTAGNAAALIKCGSRLSLQTDQKSRSHAGQQPQGFAQAGPGGGEVLVYRIALGTLEVVLRQAKVTKHF